MTEPASTSTRLPGRKAFVLAAVATSVVAVTAGGCLWGGSDSSAEEAAFCQSLLPSGEDAEESASLTECGTKLETAATGRAAGERPPATPGRHTAEQRRVLEKAVAAYADRTAEDPGSMPTEIRQHLANALAHHPREVHGALHEGDGPAGDEGAPGPGDGELETVDVTRVLRAVFEDGSAFATVQKSQTHIVSANLQGLGKDDFIDTPDHADQATAVVKDAGSVLGRLYRIRSEAIDSRTSEDATEAKKLSVRHYEQNGFPHLEALIQNRTEEVGLSENQLRGDRTQGLFDDAEGAFNGS
ncbi:hypothetical protein ACWGJ2_16860 [Streptomyces sp. NPDC054796]